MLAGAPSAPHFTRARRGRSEGASGANMAFDSSLTLVNNWAPLLVQANRAALNRSIEQAGASEPSSQLAGCLGPAQPTLKRPVYLDRTRAPCQD